MLLAVAGVNKRANERAKAAIARLSHEARILYDRGAAGALCLWPHTSVDLDEAFATAERAIGPLDTTFDHLKRLVRTDPLVARRHYVERGALRHFELLCLDSARFEDEVVAAIEPGTHAPDGRVVLLFSATDERVMMRDRSPPRRPTPPHRRSADWETAYERDHLRS